MRCPSCNSLNDKVVESRPNSTGSAIRRRRMCMDCDYRFTSYERIEERPLTVVKRDGRREPFDQQKLKRGILKSLEKCNASMDMVDDMIQDIEDAAENLSRHHGEIPSEEIGNLTLKQLYQVDPVAYVRFASVYKMFNNVDEFIQEIAQLTDGSSKK